MSAQHVTVIYGGPGTGKTHKLLELLDEELNKGTSPREMAFASFTRKGTYAGVDIARKKYGYTDADVPYFRTLHSIAYYQLGVALAKGEDLKPYFDKVGINYATVLEMLAIVDKERNNPDIEKEFRTDAVRDAYAMYLAAKKATKTVDFTDLLQLVVDRQVHLPIKVAFVDEAQDLTALQWQAADSLFADAERIYYAGDPNQALYDWAGGDVEHFVRLRRDEEVFLDESHRCPRAVWQVARAIVAQMEERIPIPPKCRNDMGFLVKSPGLTNGDSEHFLRKDIFSKQGTKYILCCNAKKTEGYRAWLAYEGIPYQFLASGEFHPSIEQRYYNWLRQLWDLTRSQELLDKWFGGKRMTLWHRGFTHWVALLDIENSLRVLQRKGHKGSLRAIELAVLKWLVGKFKRYKGEDWQKQYGGWLMAHDTSKEFLQIQSAYKAFTTSKINRAITDVTVSSIHQQKGGEADVVLLDISAARIQVRNAARRYDAVGMDSLLRMAYVGVTRAKEGLVIVYGDVKSRMFDPTNMQDIGHIGGTYYEDCREQFESGISKTVLRFI